MLLAVAVSATAWAQPIHVSAQVDKTTVEIGTQFTLVITIEGDFAKANLKPLELPKAFQVVAQSRASNLSVEPGGIKRSVSLIYVLLPQTAGTFKLGPFMIVHRGQPLLTDPIDITVNQPVLPPQARPQQRYTL